MIRFPDIVAAAALTALLAGPVVGQGLEGVIDLDATVGRQIAQLEHLVSGDTDARKQAVAYQWLIELYGYQGQQDQVDRCYRAILDFFPGDVGTLNAYAVFLMDTAGDDARAEEILKTAYANAVIRDTRSLDLGTTLQLRAEVARRTGRYELAVELADRALQLLSDERSSPTLRTRAQSLLALERYDDAAAAYLRLIGVDRGTTPEDMNALQLFAGKTTQYRTGSIQTFIDGAIADHRRRYMARIELEGGEVVGLAAEDHVALEATLRRAQGPGAVLLVHDTGSLRSVFTPYAQLLYIDDISSLSVDLRGHGGSRADSLLSYETLSPDHRARLASDVIAAYRYLQRVLGLADDRIAVVAEGNACAVVEKALYEGRIAAPVVHISPVFPDSDPDLQTAVGFHADRPALFISSQEDLAAMRSIRRFPGIDTRRHAVTRTYPDAGHGIETLRRAPEALEYFQEWLRRTVGSG